MRGSPEALAQCRVLAIAGDSTIEAERVKVDSYVFTSKLKNGSAIVAVANLGNRDLGLPGRKIPNFHVSQFETLDDHHPTSLILELRQTECFTVHTRDGDGQLVEDATVSVDFVGETDAMNWLTVFGLANVGPLASWLKGTYTDAPQVPLLRQGARLRLSAQSQGRFGASAVLDVDRSREVEIVLGQAKSFVEIEVHDPAGKPVPHLSLAYSINRKSDEISMRAGPATTDENGKVRVHIHEQDVQLEISVTSDEWYLPGVVAKFDSGTARGQLEVRPAISITLEIKFADDQPYTGPLSVYSLPHPYAFGASYEAPGVPLSYHGPRGSKPKPDPSGIYRIMGVPADRDLECTAAPQRAGFGDLQHTIPSTDLSPGANFMLVIPKATRRQASAKILFEGDWERLGRARVKVVQVAPFFGENGYDLRLTKESTLLFAGDYKVILLGAQWAWQSETFTLADGEERKVSLPCASAAGVTAVIQDQTGRPLRGAALCSDWAAWADFPASPEAGWIAVSDATGRATLNGCPSGQVELRLEADGYEPEVVSATLISGAITDIGIIALRPARGEIRIKIKNFEKIARLEPQTNLLVAGGKHGGRRGPRFLESSEVVFRGLPLGRTYSGFIGPRNGASWKALNGMKLTESEPTLTIEVDADTFDLTK